MKQTIQVPVTPELKRKLEELAKAAGLSLAAYIRHTLIKAGANAQQTTD